MNFEHVTSKKLRAILTGKSSAKQLSWGIDYTSKCLEKDEANMNISYKVFNQRENYLNKAEEMFKAGNLLESLTFLQKTWEI